MNRKILVLILFFCFLCSIAQASTLYRIRFGHYPEKIRTVFDFDGSFCYEAEESKNKIVLHLKETKASSEITNYVEINDLIIRYLQVEKLGEDLKITIPLSEPVEYNIFYLNGPPRLVIDFGREFLNIVSGGSIAEGLEHLKVRKGTTKGIINANVLKINLKKHNIKPALAKKHKPNFFESFVSLLTPWKQESNSKHFFLEKVSDIVGQQTALAGVNGTYFAGSGRPLGALMIDQELVSFPIYDRTAFFLDGNNKPYIDNVFISSHFKIKNKSRYKITGVNQPRGSKDIIMYTPAWGKKTGSNKYGIEIVVAKSIVKKIGVANSEIPEDGYVLSVRGPAIESLSENVKVGDTISAYLKAIPFATSPPKIVQLVSGGPRLLKGGRPYVSKHEEKFKMDIARGRAARTAVGITKQGDLLLVTVDGLPKKKRDRKKNESSIGVSLEELSSLMLNLGAVDAMNLDGGSSSTMIVDNQVVNKPTAGSQRRVSNAIVVLPKNH